MSHSGFIMPAFCAAALHRVLWTSAACKHLYFTSLCSWNTSDKETILGVIGAGLDACMWKFKNFFWYFATKFYKSESLRIHSGDSFFLNQNVDLPSSKSGTIHPSDHYFFSKTEREPHFYSDGYNITDADHLLKLVFYNTLSQCIDPFDVRFMWCEVSSLTHLSEVSCCSQVSYTLTSDVNACCLRYRHRTEVQQ